jgi:hypothetical protein
MLNSRRVFEIKVRSLNHGALAMLGLNEASRSVRFVRNETAPRVGSK